MCAVMKTRLCGKKLKCCKVVTLNYQLPESKYVLITGKVLSPFKKPLPNAAVVVFSIDENSFPYKKKYIGVTFTDRCGLYGFSVSSLNGVSYELKAYSNIYQ